MKRCNGCSAEKECAEFWKGQSLCIACAKERQKTRWESRSPKRRLEQHLKYKYGITHEQFYAAWDSQKGECAICSSALPDLMTYESKRRGYAIDHNHDTGEFRGILCLKCNSLLGMAGDSPRILAKAIGYLETNGFYGKGDIIDNAAVARKGGK